MCFYSTVWPCFGMAINHGLQRTAKRHLLLSAPLVVGRDYSQNKVRKGWLIERSAGVRAAIFFHTRHTLVHFSRRDFYGLMVSLCEFFHFIKMRLRLCDEWKCIQTLSLPSFWLCSNAVVIKEPTWICTSHILKKYIYILCMVLIYFTPSLQKLPHKSGMFTSEEAGLVKNKRTKSSKLRVCGTLTSKICMTCLETLMRQKRRWQEGGPFVWMKW